MGFMISNSSAEWEVFNKFVNFAESKGVTDKTAAVIDIKTVGSGIALVKSTQKKPDQNLKSANDATQLIFRASVLGLFKAKSVDELPKDVKSALDVTNDKPGKPLEARCIRAVKTAIVKLGGGVQIGDPKNFESIMREWMDDSQSKVGNALKDVDEKIFRQVSKDVYRASGVRLDEDGEKAFQGKPGADVTHEGTGQVFLLNGKQLPVPRSSGETETVGKFLESAMDGCSPTGAKVKLPEGDQTPAGKFVRLDGVRKNSLCMGAGVNPNDVVGFVATGGGNATLVTKEDEKLLLSAMYFCQQSSFSLADDPLVVAECQSALGGEPVTDKSTGRQTVNVVRSADGTGYDVYVRQKISPITSVIGEDDRPVKLYSPRAPGEMNLSTAFHVGIGDDGQVKLTPKENLAVKFYVPDEKGIDKPTFKAEAQAFVKENWQGYLDGNGKAAKWFSRLSEKEQKKFVDQVGAKVVENALEAGAPLSAKIIRSTAESLLPWGGSNGITPEERQTDALARIDKFAAIAGANRNASDFYVRLKPGTNALELESAGRRNIFRGSGAKAENNEARKALYDAVYAYYNGDVPESVLAQMTNADGSGRPLSAKRIGLIRQAIEAEPDPGQRELKKLKDNLSSVGWLADVNFIGANDFEAANELFSWLSEDSDALVEELASMDDSLEVDESEYKNLILASMLPEAMKQARIIQPEGPISKKTWCRCLGLGENVDLKKPGAFAKALYARVRNDYCEARGWNSAEMLPDDLDIRGDLNHPTHKNWVQYSGFLQTLGSGLSYEKKLAAIRKNGPKPTSGDFIGGCIPHSLDVKNTDSKKSVLLELNEARSRGSRYVLNGELIHTVRDNQDVEVSNETLEGVYDKMRSQGLTPEQIYMFVMLPNVNEVVLQQDFGCMQLLHNMNIELHKEGTGEGDLTLDLTTECRPLDEDPGPGKRPLLKHQYVIHPDGKIESTKLEFDERKQG